MIGIFFATCRHFFFRCCTIGQFPLSPPLVSIVFFRGWVPSSRGFPHRMLLPRLVRIGRVSQHALSFVHVLHVRFIIYLLFSPSWVRTVTRLCLRIRSFAPLRTFSLCFLRGFLPSTSHGSFPPLPPFFFIHLFRFVGSLAPTSLGLARVVVRPHPTPPHPLGHHPSHRWSRT